MSEPTKARSIVCGVDDSGFSDHALIAAYGLARERGLEVRLVHATGFSGLLDRLTGEDVAGARNETIARLEERLAAAGVADPEVDRCFEMVDGPAARAVVEAAERHAAKLIVLGRHQGRTSLGDTVRAVVAHAACPVLVQPTESRPVERILAAVDLSPEIGRVMAAARDEYRARGAGVTSLRVLHCFVRPELGYVFGYPIPMPPGVAEGARETAQREFTEAVAEFDWGGIEPTPDFVEADPASEILSQAGPADLVVLGTHGRTGLSFSVLGNVAGQVLEESECPVLVVRAPDRSWVMQP